jgi:hypothetical protein
MNENLKLLLLVVGYCSFMILLGIIFFKFPPKKINHLYRYRTSRSMKNQTVWDAANGYSSKLFLQLNLIACIVLVIIYFLIPQHRLIGTVLTSTMLIICTVPMTEKYLNTHFDRDGKSK